MGKFQYQKVNIQEAINHIVDKLDDESGSGFTSSLGRCLGNIRSGCGSVYSVSIIITNDKDQAGHNTLCPIIDAELLKSGKGITISPAGLFKSAERIDEADLTFPEEDEY